MLWINPLVTLVFLQVSTADVHEYKSTTKSQIKRITTDIERDWGGPPVSSEWLVLYVRPFELDINDRSARCATMHHQW